MVIKADKELDAKGLACPMPIVKTKKAMEEIQSGQVLEVQATDKGSLADIQAWSKSTGHQYLGTKEEGNILKHYLRKADPSEIKEEIKYPHITTNEELQKKLESGEKVNVLDVREHAEYSFNRIPGSKHIPLGELEARLAELNPEEVLHVVCRTGNRSDLAAQQLTEKGFKNVKNVLPGMMKWTGSTEKDE